MIDTLASGKVSIIDTFPWVSMRFSYLVYWPIKYQYSWQLYSKARYHSCCSKDRNRSIPLHFRAHCRVWCSIVLSFCWGWGSYALHWHIRYICVYAPCMSQCWNSGLLSKTKYSYTWSNSCLNVGQVAAYNNWEFAERPFGGSPDVMSQIPYIFWC